MLPRLALTEEQLNTFRDEGFVVARGLFDQKQMTKISDWSDEMLAKPEEPGKHWVYHEKSLKDDGRDLISRIEYISPFHEGFRSLSETLRGAASQFLDEEAVLFKEKINFKMPGGDGFKPHQDSQAGWDVYADFYINILVSIDPATIENGCLEICARHHKKGLFKSWEPLSESDMEGMIFKPVPTNAGAVIFFDCYVPHQSAPNLSNSTRRIYFATYNRASAGEFMERYYADKHKTYPPDIDRNIDKKYVFRV